MNTEIAAYTNKGGHPVNEDSFAYGNRLFVVADGLGSHENSKAASQCAVDYLMEKYDRDVVLDDVKLVSVMEELNAVVLRMQKQTGFTDARTTVAAAWLGGEKFRFINVGDSRVYFFRNGRILTQTQDHSVCQASVKMGELDPRDIRRSPDRSKLLKVLGERKKLNLAQPHPPIDLYDGDAFIVCSDGFWDFVTEEEMELDLHKSSTPREWMGHMLKRHLLRAQNGDDNYTVICGIVHSEKKVPAPGRLKKLLPALIALPLVLALVVGAAFGIGRLLDDRAGEMTAELVVVLSDRTEISPNGVVRDANGVAIDGENLPEGYTYADGTVTTPDGYRITAYGRISNADGAELLLEEETLLSDGKTKISPDRTIVFEDGTTLSPDGTVTIYQTDAETGEKRELARIPLDGKDPVLLSGEVEFRFQEEDVLPEGYALVDGELILPGEYRISPKRGIELPNGCKINVEGKIYDPEGNLIRIEKNKAMDLVEAKVESKPDTEETTEDTWETPPNGESKSESETDAEAALETDANEDEYVINEKPKEQITDPT